MKPLHKIAAKCCQDVYQNNIDLGTTEYSLKYGKYKGRVIHILSIAGTNELSDWWANINFTSWKGIKLGAYKAAKKIHNRIKHKIKYPLLVCGHSKAGATAIAYKRLYGAEWCCAFDPARSLRYWADRKMENTFLFIHKKDKVPKALFLNFSHPQCEIEYRDNDLSVLEAHNILNWA